MASKNGVKNGTVRNGRKPLLKAHSQTPGQMRVQTQIQAGLNAQTKNNRTSS